MIGNDVLQKIEPEKRELRQYATLVRNTGYQNVIECRDAIRGHEQQALVVHTIHVPDLATGVKFKFGEVSLQNDGVEELGSHEEILQAKIVAYSSWPEIFVNG